MTADPAQSQTLSPYSAGMKHYVDDEAMRRIVGATKLPLRPNVNFASFSSQLNNTLRIMMLRMLSLPFSQKEFSKLKDAFITYEELSKKTPNSRLFPPADSTRMAFKSYKVVFRNE